MDHFDIHAIDECYIQIKANKGLLRELGDEFTFDVPGAKFMPLYRNGMWDGKIRLLNLNNGKLYRGLLPYIEKFCLTRNYTYAIHDDLLDTNEFSLLEAEEFATSLGTELTSREYQLQSFAYCVRNNRGVIVSPTGSGKSFIIHLLTEWFGDSKILIVVPTTSLVQQMNSDLHDYGHKTGTIHMIQGGKPKVTKRRIVVSTWQSIYKQPKDYFNQFEVIIGDECHLFKAKSLTSMLEKSTEVKYRFGFTGSLDDSLTNQMVLEGLFGKVDQQVKTKELIQQGHLSEFIIKALVLNHDHVKGKMTYPEEMNYLIENEKRNRFIRNLALSLKGNSLILFQMVERHGEVLYDLIRTKGNADKCFYIHGGVSADERERIRKQVDATHDNIIIASYGTFSTGVNIRNLDNIVFASPFKSKIRGLQSIGRVLRKSDSGGKATLIDIADKLKDGKAMNITLKHFLQRVRLYNQEEFEYNVYNIKL